MRKIFISVCCVFFVLLLLTTVFESGLISKESKTKNTNPFLAKSFQNVTFGQYDANNMVTWVSTNGQIVSHIPTNNSGLEFPKGSLNHAVFAAGLWMAGKVGEDIRSAAAEFSTEFVAGPFGSNPESPRNKIFRVHPQFPDGLDINGDGDFDDQYDDLRDANIASANGEYDPFSSWPMENGAPVTATGDPDILGSSMLWMVFNDGDPFTHSNLWATQPLGVEVQTTMFGFDRLDPTGNIMFIKWLIINKGGNQIDSMFVSVWHDDDVGTAGDDLVGVDTTLSLGYTYNGAAVDGVYGVAVPAVGTDFFQGPIVPSPGDVAFAFGRQIPDFRNLELTSFAKYINGGPPEFEDPETAPEAFNYMKGLTKLGAPLINAITNQPTVFAHAGDPVTGGGWLDTNPADRRYLMNSGPFNMAPGDSQEVVGSIIIAQGTNNLNAVSALRFFDIFAQTAFDNNFDLPSALPPNFQVSELDKEVVLTWEASKAEVEAVDLGGYQFEGYNVYQGQSLTGPWTRIATFDLDNAITIVFDAEFDVETATISESPRIFGDNTGLERFLQINRNALNANLPLVNNVPHYFSVTSYLVNVDAAPRVIESPIVGRVTTPHTADLGDVLNSSAGQTVATTHPLGSTTSEITVLVVDPESVSGGNYKITFPALNQYTLTNTSTNTVEVDAGFADDAGRATTASAVGGGLTIIIDGSFAAPATFLSESQTVDADPSDPGLAIWFDGTVFAPTGDVAAVGGGVFPVAATEFLQLDIEFRFTGVPSGGATVDEMNDSPIASGGQWGTYYERTVATGATSTPADLSDRLWNPVRLPFELWDVDGGGERQVNCITLNRNSDGAAPYDATAGDPSTPGMEPRWRIAGRDYIIPMMSDYDEAFASTSRLGWDGTHASGRPNSDFTTWYLFFHQGGEAGGGDTWTTGDEFSISYANPIIPDIDEYEFTITANVRDDQNLARTAAGEMTNVFPNPYFGSSLLERDPVNRFVTFTHLPTDGETTIRIFTIAGGIVRTLTHDGSSQFIQWDLRNERSLPVASGVYLVLFDFKGLGTKKTMKLAIFQPEERLQVF